MYLERAATCLQLLNRFDLFKVEHLVQKGSTRIFLALQTSIGVCKWTEKHLL